MDALFSQDKNHVVLPQNNVKVSRFWDWLFNGLFGVGAVTFFLPFALLLTPIRWVVTASSPIGFYWETGKKIERGAYVHFCLPEDIAKYAFERGYIRGGTCPGMYEELLKPVAAVEGDMFRISEEEVWINNEKIHAPIYRADSKGRPHQFWIEPGMYGVPEGQVVVLSTHSPRSWDSRYFGQIAVSAIRGTAVPWWVWG